MSMISLGAHSLFSFSTMAKPPTAYNKPPQLTRFTELLSWENSGKDDHLQQGAFSCINVTSPFCCVLVVLKYLREFLLTFFFIWI